MTKLSMNVWWGGRFTAPPRRLYVDGTLTINDCDPDFVSVKDIGDEVLTYGPTEYKALWWLVPNMTLDDGLRPLATDNDVRNMVEVGMSNNHKVDIWVEHNLPHGIVDKTADYVSIPILWEVFDDGEPSRVNVAVCDFDVGPSNASLAQNEDNVEHEDEVNNEHEDEDNVEHEDEDNIEQVFDASDEGDSRIGWEFDQADDAPDNDIYREAEEEIYGAPDDDLSDPDADSNPTFNLKTDMRKKFKFEVGMRFRDNKTLTKVLHEYGAYGGYEVKVKKSEKTKFAAVCSSGCSWRIYASHDPRDKYFYVRHVEKVHTCVRSSTNNNVTDSFLSQKFEKEVRDDFNWGLDTFRKKVRRKFRVQVNRLKVYRARKKARIRIHGDASEQFYKLPNYCEELRRSNPGSTVILENYIPQPFEKEQRPMFKRLYICLAACKSGFLAACRPFIGLDGCFLKTVHGGQLLTAVGIDANNDKWPLAYAVVEKENQEH